MKKEEKVMITMMLGEDILKMSKDDLLRTMYDMAAEIVELQEENKALLEEKLTLVDERDMATDVAAKYVQQYEGIAAVFSDMAATERLDEKKLNFLKNMNKSQKRALKRFEKEVEYLKSRLEASNEGIISCMAEYIGNLEINHAFLLESRAMATEAYKRLRNKVKSSKESSTGSAVDVNVNNSANKGTTGVKGQSQAHSIKCDWCGGPATRANKDFCMRAGIVNKQTNKPVTLCWSCQAKAGISPRAAACKNSRGTQA